MQCSIGSFIIFNKYFLRPFKKSWPISPRWQGCVYGSSFHQTDLCWSVFTRHVCELRCRLSLFRQSGTSFCIMGLGFLKYVSPAADTESRFLTQLMPKKVSLHLALPPGGMSIAIAYCWSWIGSGSVPKTINPWICLC